MKTKTITQLIITLLLATALLLLIGLLLTPAAGVRTAEASKVDGYAQYTWTFNGFTSTQTGTGKVTADYGTLECYETVDVTDLQTVTLQLEHSPNNSVWADQPVWQFTANALNAETDFADVSADGTSFAVAVAYGMYTRPIITVGNTNPVTVTLRCIAKDRTDSIDDAAGAIEFTD